MNDGSFGSIYEEMKKRGMSIPSDRVQISIPSAKEVFVKCFEYFLSFQKVDFTWHSEYEQVVSWLENNEGKGLVLYGDCGRGKTMISRFVIPAILLKYSGKVVSVYDVQDMNKNADDVLKKHILSVDDVGTEDLSVVFGNKRLVFAEIMDAVEKYGKLIIISTNLNKDSIVKTYGERVFDRIIATTKRVEFKGESMRK